MSLRKTPFIKGEYYHLYNRGNSKQTIFHDRSDYDRFLKLLFLSNSENNFRIFLSSKNVYGFDRGKQLVGIGAYCLMPNHFHILITQIQGGGISKFMQKLSTGYSMYYNRKYKRTGTLFEGKFKAQHADDDEYLKYLFSYIHLNPIKLIDKDWKEEGIKDKSRAKEYLEQYNYSSFLDYIDFDRVQNKIISKDAFPKYFLDKEAVRKDIFDWLSLSRQDLEVLPR